MIIKKSYYLSGLVLFISLSLLFSTSRSKKHQKSDTKKEPAPEVETNLSKEIGHSITRPAKVEGISPPESTDNVCQRLNDSLDTGRLQEALVEARRLINHTDRDVREQVAYALDWIGIDALPELSSMMTDGDTTVAEIAASAFWENLYDLEDPEFKGELLSLLLQSPVVAIQKRAVDEIGFLPPTQSIPLILGKVPSADPELYLTIQNNLYFLSGGEEFRTLDEWESWYQNNKEVFENE